MNHLAWLAITALGLQDGAATATAPEAAPPASVTQAQGVTFRMTAVPKEKRAPVQYESPSGGIYFQVKVAGRDVWAVLHTGASTSLVDIEFARSAGLTIAPKDEKSWLASDVTVLVPGQFETRMPHLVAVELRTLSDTIGRKIDFMMGVDFLQPLVLIVDPSTQKLNFGPSGAFKPTADTTAIDLQAGMPPRVEVDIAGEKVLVAIDTGFNSQLTLTAAAWARTVPKGATMGSTFTTGRDGKTYAQRTAQLPEITMGSLTLSDVKVNESQTVRADGVVGTGLLGKFRLALDVKSGKLWLAPAPPRSPTTS